MPTILTVDDQPENLYLLEVLLKSRGIQVVQAVDGADALAKARAQRPDLVISDILMPSMDGFTLCREWKKDPDLKNIPFVFYTATYTEPQDEQLALNLGADMFIVKPTDPSLFIESIDDLLESYQQGEVISNEPLADDAASLREHNQALVRKLEQKMSELKAANRTLRASEERYHSLFHHVPVGLYLAAFSGEILEANQALVQILGYPSMRALLDAGTGRLFNDASERSAWVERLIREGEIQNYETQWRRCDGQLIWVKESARALPSEAGELLLYESVVEDVTERRDNLARIQRQVKFLNALRSIDLTITNRLDLAETLSLILKEVISQLNVDAAAIFLLDEKGETLSLLALTGFRTLDKAQAERISVKETLAGRAVREKRLISGADPQQGRDNYDVLKKKNWDEEGFQYYLAAPLIVSGEVTGVLEIFHRSPLQPEADWWEFLSALSVQAAVGIDNRLLFQKEQRAHQGILDTYRATLEGWSKMLDLRDRETEGHTRRVIQKTLQLASAMGVSGDDLELIRQGALLHDIGKMGVPDQILLKNGPLTAEEWRVMRMHPTYAYEMLQSIEYLRSALVIPLCHHEHFDGAGYPSGLKGEEIPLWARIFAVVDVFEALTSDRPYRPAWTHEKALEYIRRQAGLQFDPAIVARFLDIMT